LNLNAFEKPRFLIRGRSPHSWSIAA